MNKKFIFILWAKWHVANFDMPMWCQFGWHMSSSNLINLMTLIWTLPLNFDLPFCNWLDKFLPPTIGWLKLFGFEEDGWVVIGGAVVDRDCGSHGSCHCGYGFLFWKFFWFGSVWLNWSMFPSEKKKKNIESAIFDLSSSKIDAKGAFCFQFFGSFWGKEVCGLLGLKDGFRYNKGASLRKW